MWIASHFVSIGMQSPIGGASVYKWGWIVNQKVTNKFEATFDTDAIWAYSSYPTLRTVPFYYPSRAPRIPTGVFSAFVFIPHWIIVGPTGLLCFFFPRKLKYSLPGSCKKCDYDLTGNESGICSECGDENGR